MCDQQETLLLLLPLLLRRIKGNLWTLIESPRYFSANLLKKTRNNATPHRADRESEARERVVSRGRRWRRRSRPFRHLSLFREDYPLHLWITFILENNFFFIKKKYFLFWLLLFCEIYMIVIIYIFCVCIYTKKLKKEIASSIGWPCVLDDSLFQTYLSIAYAKRIDVETFWRKKRIVFSLIKIVFLSVFCWVLLNCFSV